MEDPVAAPSAAAPSIVAPPPPATQQVPAAAAAPEVAGVCRRQLFSVELRTGETTIVSWKKLQKEAGHAATLPPLVPPPPAAAAAKPTVADQLGPPSATHPTENDPEDPSQPNRFNAVIEKIERLYMGKHSSDEEDLDDLPDDDQYDTDDSFIDDAELDEYFEVDNLKTKHSGYFVNKGMLEQIEPGTSTDAAPKKRRRKDTTGPHTENSQGAPGNYLDINNMPGKSSAIGAAFVGKKLSSSNLGSYGEYCHENNTVMRNKSSATGVPKKKSTDFSMGSEAVARSRPSKKDTQYTSPELKDLQTHKAAALRPIDFAQKTRTSDTHDYASAYRDKATSMELDFQRNKTHSVGNQDPANKIYRKEKHGMSESPCVALASTVYSTQAMHPIATSAGTKPKGSRLERAIRDLQKVAAEYRPPAIDINEAEPNNQASVKRRLPQEVKQKLAKVARLSANHGKIQEHELMNRLMGILGHLVQRRTLKRNMKEMVELGISAKHERADRIQHVKTEIDEMVKARMAAKAKVNEQQDGSADDFLAVNDERRALKGKSVMDTILEDRICDLYDLYVEGMDEDKGPQSRKLYVELSELWPQGYMDNFGIKDAISRSKERRRPLYSQQKVRNEERLKRKRLAAQVKLQDGYPAVLQSAPPPQMAQSSITNPVTTHPATNYGQSQGSKGFERVCEISAGAIPDNNSKENAGETKKKRKLESDLLDTQPNPLQVVPPQHGREQQKPPKHSTDANASILPSTDLPS